MRESERDTESEIEASLVVIQLFLGYYFRMEWFAFQWLIQATEIGVYVLCLLCYFSLSQH